MTKSERNQIIKWVNTLTDEELEKEYYDAVFDTLGSQAEKMYERGWDMQDIIEREKYDKGYADGKRDAMDRLVRCEDCNYSYVCGDGTTLRCDVLFPSLSWVNSDDFCSQGERRSENE